MKINNQEKLISLNQETEGLSLSDKRERLIKYINEEVKYSEEFFQKRRKAGKEKKRFSPDHKHILENAPSWIFEDEEITLHAMNKGVINLTHVSKVLSDDISYIKRYFKETRLPFYFVVNETFFKDKEIFLMAFEKDPRVYSMSYNLKTKFDITFQYEKSFIMELITKDKRVYEYLRDSDKKDKDILMLAIKSGVNLDLFKKADTQRFLKDKEFAFELMKSDPKVFPYLSMKLRSDKDFCLSVISVPNNYKDISYQYRVRAYHDNLRFVSKSLKSNKDFMKNYINHRSFYELIGDDLKKDKELMTEFFRKNPISYKLVEDVVESNIIYDVLLSELKIEQGYYIYKYLSDEYKEKVEVIYEYLKHFDKKHVREDSSNFNILPAKVIEDLNNELTEYKINNNLTWDFSNESHFRDISLLDFARSKYLGLYLNLSSEKDKKDKKFFKI